MSIDNFQDYSGKIAITSEVDIVAVRKEIRSACQRLGFNDTDVTRIVTAASELARNIYKYASQGNMHWKKLNQIGRIGVELLFEDRGPGIRDIDLAMSPGFTTSRGLGLGLPGAKRLMDEIDVESTPGVGTNVVIRKWLKGRIVSSPQAA
ncbi:anti-sigma regulatory factor [Pseudodesulfovibrio sp. zrk46]|uniref:anti-sigma regulatory factor n=1 Tax=Pseudodesulfovibrio sp. zrk46 TaxID=2725288 RepID=UPI0014491021|nr:anti-sigma regulatory factor [Pseudodesulfovibrio sp. zrk46]QJB57178.1 anti-sigma regulatory factor [Pseudodesulfovibrio sp. zrk46]